MRRAAPVLVLCVGLASSVNANWLEPFTNPKGKLAEARTCSAAPSNLRLELGAGTEILLVQHSLAPPHHVYWEVDVLSGPHRGWRCRIESGHPPLILDEKVGGRK